MIKLLVSSGMRSTVTHSFSQPAIIIGSAPESEIDLSLPEPFLEAQHLKIYEDGDRFFAINLANDPFTTINGLPFGKKLLQTNDIIEFGDITIRFIGDSSIIESPTPALPSTLVADTQEALPPILEKALSKNQVQPQKNIESSHFLSHATTQNEFTSYHIEAFSDSINDDTLTDFDSEHIDIDDLVRQVEELDKSPSSASTPVPLQPEQIPLPPQIDEVQPYHNDRMGQAAAVDPITPNLIEEQDKDLDGENAEAKEPKSNAFSPKQSLKDFYLSEYDDVQDSVQLPLNRSGRPPASKNLVDSNNWRLLLKIFIFCIILASILAGFGYLWVSDQSEEEEIKAAKGVADVAMALTYAQIKHIRPQNQNWSDPEFIKNNLTAVLASKHLSLAEFDTHGQLTNCPYLLRIYTSNDLSQFLVLAQPAPSVMQWLIPKATITIDSNSMEMRKVNDLKTLNRLLVTANTLDGTSGTEISQLIREAPLIPLADLVTPRENQGFAPPKALALMHPGAENLVYNAPRYYHLGDDLMKKSFDLIEKSAAPHEITLLQQEINTLSKFPNLVFYASGGIQQATQGQKALSVIAPNDKFLIAYLKLTNKGKISSSHLLMDDTPLNLAENEIHDKDSTHAGLLQSDAMHEHGLEGSLSLNLHSKENVKDPHPSAKDTDKGHPIYLQLAALTHSRQQALKSASEALITLINKNDHSPQADFSEKFQALSQKYTTLAQEQQNKAGQKIAQLNEEHKKIPAVQFLEWIRAAGIESMFRTYLTAIKSEEGFQEPSRGLIDNQLTRIENSSNWQDMEKEVSIMAEMLTFNQVPDPDRLITYQNATRSRVIQKLNQFLLSSNCPLEAEAFDISQRPVLSSILQTCWICDSETLGFYLSEFDLHSQPPPKEVGSKN